MQYEVGPGRQTVKPDVHGNLREVIELPVRFEDGSSISVDIPVRLYREDYVRPLVERLANEHAAIHAIGGETG